MSFLSKFFWRRKILWQGYAIDIDKYDLFTSTVLVVALDAAALPKAKWILVDEKRLKALHLPLGIALQKPKLYIKYHLY